MDEDFRQAALDYHRLPRPGKIAIEPTKRMASQRDLALAYSPGVAAACEAIAADPQAARDYTSRANLVGVITNGTAVLGLGAIGPLAGKPVMEGKAALFKKFAGIDVFDIEVDASDPARFIDVVAALEPTFGAINLEDIKAPECFEIERELRARMCIPVFHDDQHGTAITVAAAVRNALVVQGKSLADTRLVTSGAGAAALACVDLLVAMGLRVENVTLTDVKGVVYAGREPGMAENMARYARKTDARLLPDVLAGADIFMGLSAPRVFKPEWLPMLADKPIILALANPDPEIMPELVRAARPDAIIASGRSDYPNQVNNVLCFPFIFRGALDVGATTINDSMKLAAVEAIAALARMEASEVVARAYGGTAPIFGPDYIIPKPFDPRLILEVAPAVAKAAMASGVARHPITDFDAYRSELERFVFRSGQLMRPVFEAARKHRARIVYTEGEDERVLRAVQTVVDEGLAQPVLVGRRDEIARRIRDMGLRMRLDGAVQVLDPAEDGAVFDALVEPYQRLVARRGVPPEAAARRVRNRQTVAAAMLLHTGQVDAALCGGTGDWWRQMEYLLPIIPRRRDVSRIFALSALILQSGTVFLCDTHMNIDPTAEQLAEMTGLAAAAVEGFGIAPKVALLSHSSFGASKSPSARKMRKALGLVRAQFPELEVDGEMHADAALSEAIRERVMPGGALSGTANLLIMPNLDAANIAFNMAKAAADGLPVGPLLLGMSKPAHVLVPSVTARGIVNMTALAAGEVGQPQGEKGRLGGGKPLPPVFLSYFGLIPPRRPGSLRALLQRGFPVTKKLLKAVLPVAGLGTRFLPATKAMAKEMLPVVDKPLIQYAVEEARAAGIEQFCFITGRGKVALVEHFDVAFELEATLRQRGKERELAALRDSAITPGNIVTVRQQEPMGLGHAIWCARAFIGDDPFAILLPDDLILSQTPVTKQLAEAYYETGGNVVAVTEVPREHTNRYGILKIGHDDGRMVEVTGLVEKPKPEDAPSNLSIIGRYVLLPDVIEHLARMERGAGNEVQLTDGMARMIGNTPFHGLRYEGKRFDCGDKIGYLEAQIAFALSRPDIAPSVRAFLGAYQES